MIQEEKPAVQITTNDLIYSQVKDLSKRMDRLENRMDKLEDKLETTRRELTARLDKQEEKIERLADKIDELRRDLSTGTNHGQIANITTVGIALAVIYSILK